VPPKTTSGSGCGAEDLNKGFNAADKIRILSFLYKSLL
jgi:hypothetical protein